MDSIDVAIIGGGCAGLAAALYAKRYELNTVVFAKEIGGLITTTHIVENYPGIKPMSGWDMMNIFLDQMKLFDVEIRNQIIDSIQRDGDQFILSIGDEQVTAKTVILSTGTKHRHLNAPGEKEYANKGVSYCATCDGAFFKGVPIVIIGGGDSAAKEALLLAGYGSHVYVIARSTLKAEPINASRIAETENITVLEGTQVTEIKGDGNKVTSVTLNKEVNGSAELAAEGVFIAIGHIPQTELATQVGAELNAKSEVVITRTSKTNIPGFFAAGDCTDTEWKQGIISAAEGSQAANSAFEYLTGQ